jgi:hypothetical protein
MSQCLRMFVCWGEGKVVCALRVRYWIVNDIDIEGKTHRFN